MFLRLSAFCILSFVSQPAVAQTDTTLLQAVEVAATRATEKTPVAKTNLDKATIQRNNIGQDLPFILQQTPSVIVNSDAGTGIGYTALRLRGTDGTRINVTLNGIPYNDAESQMTYFVDMPDIAASASSIQVQRGVGTSTNGSGAFGGTINISTNELIKTRGLQLQTMAGSYGTLRNSLTLNSGMLGKFTIDGRVSYIKSDGYIDRAFSKLFSGYGSVAYTTPKSSVRFNVINGNERTYQAWNGIDEVTLKTNRRYNSAGTEKPGTPYENEIDKYNQTHYQLFYNQSFNQYWKSNLTGFLTRGKGYYEQYKADRKFSDYNLPDHISGSDTTTRTDLVRRLWLDNYFYGGLFSLQYNSPTDQWITGGGYYIYDGKHYGHVLSTTVPVQFSAPHLFYNHPTLKKDANIFTKWTHSFAGGLNTFIDLQVRNVAYDIFGFRDNPDIDISSKYTFFNPKAGLSFKKGNTNTYLSFGVANKEPNRDDFEAGAAQQPRPERLYDLEAGTEYKTKTSMLGANLYYMNYKDQLVLTGKINDVGAYTRTNIANSYRLGIELQAASQFTEKFSANANLTLSKNKIRNFIEYLDDYDTWEQKINEYRETDISFSPAVTGNLSLIYSPVKRLELMMINKYVSRQFLDNTSNKNRSINPYYTADARITYNWAKNKIKEGKLFVQANNVTNTTYEANGYTFSYYSGGNLETYNYYFPMAPINFTAGIVIGL